MKTKIIVSELAKKSLITYFEEKNFEVVLFKDMNKPYKGVSTHPDMFMFYDNKLFLEKDVKLKEIINFVYCEKIGKKYPETIKYNICKIGNYIICKYENISEELKRHFKINDYKIINVKQGYTKCSTAIIDDKSIITSDKGIYLECKDKLSVLLIESGHIVLENFDYGFIGGTCVSFGNIVFFNGDISNHPDYVKIKKFIESKNKIIEFMNYPLEDLGSFIIIG